jgi:hypothetical protein
MPVEILTVQDDADQLAIGHRVSLARQSVLDRRTDMQRANKRRAQIRLLLKQARRLHQSSTTMCAAWSCEPPGAKKRQVSIRTVAFDQGAARSRYSTNRSAMRAAMITTEIMNIASRAFALRDRISKRLRSDLVSIRNSGAGIYPKILL